MGMFDYVKFRCPACQSVQSTQSKSGPCNMDEYTLETAPARILIDLEDESEVCTKCGVDVRFSVRAIVTATAYVPIPQEEDWED